MSTNIYCAVEVFDEDKKKWIGTDCNFINLCARDFISGSENFRYIFTGPDFLPEPKVYSPKEQSYKVKTLVNATEDIGSSKQNIYYGFVYYTMDELKYIIDKLAREYYCRNLYKELKEVNELRAKAEVLDFIKKGLDVNTDNATLKQLINNAEEEIGAYYDPNELEETYQSMKYVLQDFVAIYLKMKNSYIDNNTGTIVDYDAVDWNDWDRYKSTEDLQMRVVFYFSC